MRQELQIVRRTNFNAERKASLFHSCLQILSFTSGNKCLFVQHGRQRVRRTGRYSPMGYFCEVVLQLPSLLKDDGFHRPKLQTWGVCPPQVLSELFTLQTQLLPARGLQDFTTGFDESLNKEHQKKSSTQSIIWGAQAFIKENPEGFTFVPPLTAADSYICIHLFPSV